MPPSLSHRVFLAAAGALLAASLLAATLATAATTSAVPAERIALLSRGINLSLWFTSVPKDEAKHFARKITAEDLSLLGSLGFRHVRIPTDPEFLAPGLRQGRAALSRTSIGHLDDALDLVAGSGMAAIVDIQPDPKFTDQIGHDPQLAEAMRSFWSALANHLARRDPDKLFLEILNEPGKSLDAPGIWPTLLGNLVEAVRVAAPHHTLIVSGATYGHPKGLLQLEPLADPNIIYNFHYYEPMVFTHQGASWSGSYYGKLGGLPYPANSENVAAAQAKLADQPKLAAIVGEFGKEAWNADRLGWWIKQAADWGRRHDVPITCNEFGVWRGAVDPAARARWIADVRKALERQSMGWTFFDCCDGGFTLMRASGRPRTPDPEIVDSLGLS